MSPAAIDARRDPSIRFPRQVQQVHQLLDYILNTQDKPHLRRVLGVHYRRLSGYLDKFFTAHQPPAADDGTVA